MADPLDREFRVFGRYLVGRDPGAIALAYYASWHRTQGDDEARRSPRIDRTLVAVARIHPVATRLCDAYSARFRRASLLRRKLVLVLALVECSPTTWRLVETPGPGGRFPAYLRLCFGAAFEALSLVLAAVVLLPVHGISLLVPERGRP